MSFNKFVQHLRKRISNHATPVDTNDLWANVHAELYPEKENKFPWLWFCLAGLCFIGSLAAYQFYFEKASPQIVEIENKTEKGIEINDSVAIDHEKSVAVNSENNFENLNIDQINKSKNVKATKAISKQGKDSERENKNANKKKIVTSSSMKNKDLIFKEVHKISQNNSSKFEGHIVSQDGVQEEMQAKTKSIQKNRFSEQSLEETKKIESPLKLDSKIVDDSQLQLNELAQEITENKIDDNIAINTNTLLDPEKELEQDKQEVISDNITDTPVVEKPEESAEEDKVIVQNKSFHVGAGIYSGVKYLTTQLSSLDRDDRELTGIRNESEVDLETTNFGLELLLKHKCGIYLNSGIEYSKSVRRFDFNKSVVTKNAVDGYTTIYINPISLDSTFVEGKLLETTETFRTKKIYNKLHLVSFPVQLGYTFDINRWSVSVQGGTVINLSAQYEGQIMDSPSSFYDLKKDEANWFKDKLDLSFQGQAFLGYNLIDNLQLLGGFSINRPVTLSEKNNPVHQTQMNLGVQLGARYWW